MLDPWNREDHYRDLAEECRRLAVTSFSIQMSNRYWRMAEGYSMLAKAGGGLAYHSTATNLQNSERMASGWRVCRTNDDAKTVLQLSFARAPAFALSDPVESRNPGGARIKLRAPLIDIRDRNGKRSRSYRGL
jgi:hypothetical protein